MTEVTSTLHIVTEGNVFTLTGNKLALNTFLPSFPASLNNFPPFTKFYAYTGLTLQHSPPHPQTHHDKLPKKTDRSKYKDALTPNISYVHGQVSRYTLCNSCCLSHTHIKQILDTEGTALSKYVVQINGQTDRPDGE